jgi:hypothetical protein
MPYVRVRHKVKDYDQWKPIDGDDKGTRRAGGSRYRSSSRARHHDLDPRSLAHRARQADLTMLRRD